MPNNVTTMMLKTVVGKDDVKILVGYMSNESFLGTYVNIYTEVLIPAGKKLYFDFVYAASV